MRSCRSLTAFALGAGHALTPGHGKTLMAAYLVGTRGTPLHAVGLGLSVTVSHTLGILVLAALVVGAQGVLPPDVVVRVAPVIAARHDRRDRRLDAAREVRRARCAPRAVAGTHDARPRARRTSIRTSTSTPHDHDARARARRPRRAQPRRRPPLAISRPAGSTISWRGLFALGLAGGLIPSTSALLILLGSIVAGRPAFGFLLVVVFGLGMAAVMTGVGLAMVFARSAARSAAVRLRPRPARRHAPLVAAVVVLAFGVYLTAQAIGGRPVF